MMVVAEAFEVVTDADKAAEEAYWKREQARWDFSEWQVSRHEAQTAAELEAMAPAEREIAEYVPDDCSVEPW